jgi:FMN reductase
MAESAPEVDVGSAAVTILGIAASPHGAGTTTAAVGAFLEGSAGAGARTELLELSAVRDHGIVLGAMQRADGIVFGSPTYRATHTSLLGGFLERVGRGGPHEISAPLKGKATAIVMTGAAREHFLATGALQNILSAFFAVQVLSPPLFLARGAVEADGQLAAAARQRAQLHGRALVDLAVACRASKRIAALEPVV